ncbi:MAG: hypothetical protein ACREK8_03235 [Gemmatimonadales bacterium]
MTTTELCIAAVLLMVWFSYITDRAELRRREERAAWEARERERWEAAAAQALAREDARAAAQWEKEHERERHMDIDQHIQWLKDGGLTGRSWPRRWPGE